MKLTGHKTEAIYRRYAIVSPGDLQAGVERLARLHEMLEEVRVDEGSGSVGGQSGVQE